MKVESFAVEEVYGDADAPVCPYRLITEQESLVYRTLLPKETTIEMYKSGPIPLRILQIGAHAVEVLSCKLLIWHPEDAREKDPVLIGRMGDRGDMYLLARWGEELEEFQVLATKAKVKLAAELHAKLLKIRAEVDAKLLKIRAEVDGAVASVQALAES